MSYIKTNSYNELLADSIRKHWENDSLSDYGIQTYKYKDIARQIEILHIVFENAGVKPGDKIALCGRNMSNWGVCFLGVLTYGAVAVPILHEFHPEQVHDIVNHSESKMLFVGDNVWNNLNAESMPALEGIICIKDFELLVSRSEKLTFACENTNLLFGKKYPQNFLPEHIKYYNDQPEELAIINYTSGTTSNSKGVMIPYRAIMSNAEFGFTVLSERVSPGDNILSILPMAHMYGMAFEFLFQFIYGMHVYFLTKIASPTILLKALAEVKPCVLVLVPLIIEKIVRKAVLPKLQDPKVRLLMKMPVVGQHIRKKICDGLTQALGGRFFEVIIGGAALNPEIETLLKEIGFRYCIGYGATECAPIISYENWFDQVPRSCGKSVVNMEIKINSSDQIHKEGEILVKGKNVMLGYYKNPEATEQALDKEGWYHTGDMGVFDEKGNLFIKGRCKNMLLGANGQNIYPEEIEDKLTNMPMVTECVVIQKGEKLYGLVYPDQEKIAKLGLQKEDLVAIMEQNRKELNPTLPNYAQLSGIKLMDEEFEKTPKKSIKRFKYMNAEI